jgi:hypothetical protein
MDCLQWVTRPPKSGFVPTIPLLVCDIETPNSAKLNEDDERDDDPSFTIVRCSMSVAWASAVTFPWVEPYIGIAKRALAEAAVVVFWNESFDYPRLVANGCEINGEVHDCMWQWHWLQSDLLKGLGFVAPFYCDIPAWKHLSDAAPEYYSGCDADATFRCYVKIRESLTHGGRWARFVTHCIRAADVFRRPQSGRITVDKVRQAVLRLRLESLEAEALAVVQADTPVAVRRLKTYKRKPADYDAHPERYLVERHPCSCVACQPQLPLAEVEP